MTPTNSKIMPLRPVKAARETDDQADHRLVFRILAVDDDPEIRDIYKDTLELTNFLPSKETPLSKLQAKLFGNDAFQFKGVDVNLVLASQGDQAVEIIRQALVDNNPFAVVFLDLRMPPGPDGLWTAKEIRKLDPNVELLVVTAYSDMHPMVMASQVPPPEKFFFIKKPFHPQEILQFSYALGAKWRAERLLEEANRELERKVHARTAELEEVNKRLEKMAITDDLTGLYNRRYIRQRLETEMDRAVRYQRPFSLLMLDLDRFKLINDRYGHPFGDIALKRASEIMLKGVRSSDLVARFGGEEFLIVLVETDQAAAYTVAENMRLELQNDHLTHEQKIVHMTVSIGVASFPKNGNDQETLLQSADQALYRAKAGGRNKVVVAENEPAG